MPNIKLSYLYRDAGNYKNFDSVIFTNTQSIPLVQIEEIIKNSLIEGQWFVANEWGLPNLYFEEYKWDKELDHDWHEYESIEETEERTTDSDINSFLENIQRAIPATL